MPPSDPRRVIGGAVWAKSTAVSNDSRRIYGVEADKTWIVGEVLEVLVNRPEGARRATTLIKAKYRIGESCKKIKILGLSQLKKENPAEEGNGSTGGESGSLVITNSDNAVGRTLKRTRKHHIPLPVQFTNKL